MRLIDADELKKALAEMWYENNIRITGLSVAELIDEAPTIEPSKSTEQNVADVPSGDLISRTDAIKVVMAEGRNVHASEYANAERIIHEADAVEVLAMLPSADRPQVNSNSAEEQIAETCDRPKGEWKWTHGGQCSECGFHNSNFDFNFCPNCGARMKGGAE